MKFIVLSLAEMKVWNCLKLSSVIRADVALWLIELTAYFILIYFILFYFISFYLLVTDTEPLCTNSLYEY